MLPSMIKEQLCLHLSNLMIQDGYIPQIYCAMKPSGFVTPEQCYMPPLLASNTFFFVFPTDVPNHFVGQNNCTSSYPTLFFSFFISLLFCGYSNVLFGSSYNLFIYLFIYISLAFLLKSWTLLLRKGKPNEMNHWIFLTNS